MIPTTVLLFLRYLDLLSSNSKNQPISNCAFYFKGRTSFTRAAILGILASPFHNTGDTDRHCLDWSTVTVLVVVESGICPFQQQRNVWKGCVDDRGMTNERSDTASGF